MKLLLVEDNPAMQTTLQRSFEKRGAQVVVCGDGARALDRWRAAVPDVVLLDLSLPGADGLQILAAARAEGLKTPVLILTARGTVGDRVLGLNTGADDYLAKPFDLDELEARVAALVRRAGGGAPAPAFGGLQVDAESGAILRQGVPMELTAGTQGRYVLSAQGQVLARGLVGTPVNAGGVALQVRRLSANPGMRFQVTRYDPSAVMAALLESVFSIFSAVVCADASVFSSTVDMLLSSVFRFFARLPYSSAAMITDPARGSILLSILRASF